MKAAIKIDTSRIGSPVSPMIYGHFWEHFGDCIYGGVYDPSSPLADEDGFRADVLEVLRDMEVPLIRWPGGNFASSYRWEDGVGPAARRPVRFDPNWRADETNRFGTDEFLRLCKKIGTRPCLVANMGDGTFREAADWVEYCNGGGSGVYASLRRENGRDEPYGVAFWGLGNEAGYDHQVGAYTDAGDYIKAVTAFARSMKFVDPDIELIASGLDVFNGEHGWKGLDWNYRLLAEAGGLFDYLSVHNYMHGGFAGPRRPYAEVAAHLNTIEAELKAASGLIQATGQLRRRKRPVRIAFDEWNQLGWALGDIGPEHTGNPAAENDDNSAYDLLDALYSASMLNMFIRMAEYVGMANFSPGINARGFLRVEKRGVLKRPSWHVFKLYRCGMGDRVVDSYCRCGRFAGRPILDVAATLCGEDGDLAVSVVNWSPETAVEASLGLDRSGSRYSGVEERRIDGVKGVGSFNDWDHPEDVKVEVREHRLPGGSWDHRFPAHSVTLLRLTR